VGWEVTTVAKAAVVVRISLVEVNSEVGGVIPLVDVERR
jgi:hypothetical protein